MKKTSLYFILLCINVLSIINSKAQNPFILNQFTADPSARVFDGKVYVYPSHDIICEEGKGFIGFCMQDYHVFSSENLTDWTDHGVIVSQEEVAWVDSATFSMWAPDCIYKNGKYYFYFPAAAKDRSTGWGRRIGVAISDKPYGPFIPQPNAIEGIFGIDPNPFIDKDGKAYIYWGSGRELLMARLNENMLELDSKPEPIKQLPEGFKEGPFLFERNGIYYFTFPYVTNKVEKLAYATGNSPMGPFEYKGVIMDESPVGCWTNHHSIIEYNGQWYLFYHHNDLSPDFDKNRSVRVDSLFFNSDGTIQKVKPTLRGVGITEAQNQIQIDRYSEIYKNGASIDFLDTKIKNKGWKTTFYKKGSWIKYNRVDFSKIKPTHVNIRAKSVSEGTVEIRLNNTNGIIVAKVNIAKSNDWQTFKSELDEIPSGIQDLVVVSTGNTNLEIDWISFE